MIASTGIPPPPNIRIRHFCLVSSDSLARGTSARDRPSWGSYSKFDRLPTKLHEILWYLLAWATRLIGTPLMNSASANSPPNLYLVLIVLLAPVSAGGGVHEATMIVLDAPVLGTVTGLGTTLGASTPGGRTGTCFDVGLALSGDRDRLLGGLLDTYLVGDLLFLELDDLSGASTQRSLP
jgi:hypothetical protein